jgi:hypothetical protein
MPDARLDNSAFFAVKAPFRAVAARQFATLERDVAGGKTQGRAKACFRPAAPDLARHSPMARLSYSAEDEIVRAIETRSSSPTLEQAEAAVASLPVWAGRWVRFLDDALRIPGTQFRFGADALLGLLLPGVGDALSAVLTLSLFWLAWQRSVPKVVLARMGVNVALDAVLGAVPLLGDAFDFAFKANRKNLELLARQRTAPEKGATLADYAVLLAAALLVLAALALPFVVAGLLARYLWTQLV